MLWLFQRFPPTNAIFGDPSLRPAEEYEAERTFPHFMWFGEGSELFQGKDVLDLGSGYGGRPVAYLEYGARSVTGLEVSEGYIHESHRFAREKHARVRYVTGVGEALPFPDATFDLIAMFDVMEHVTTPRLVLAECFRTLRPGGHLATVFPPYYHWRAGSHLRVYATKFPGLNLLFSTRRLRHAAARHMRSQGYEPSDYLPERPTDKLWMMNGLTARGWKRMLRSSDFRAARVRYIGDLDHRTSGYARRLRPLRRAPFSWPFELAAMTPGLREILCYRIAALLEKPA